MDKDNESLNSETFSTPKEGKERIPYKGKWKWVIEYIRWSDGFEQHIADADADSRALRTFASEKEAIRGAQQKIHRVYGDPFLQEPGEDLNREVTVAFTVAHCEGAGRSEHVYVTTPAKCTSLNCIDDRLARFGIEL